MENEFNV